MEGVDVPIKKEEDAIHDEEMTEDPPKVGVSESKPETNSLETPPSRPKESTHLQSRLAKHTSPRGSSEPFLCSVCSDIASGYHYGVPACEGCKAFFKRSLQVQEINYKCPANGACKIDKMSRKCCQACRLEKCKGVGMSPDFLGNKIKKPKGEKTAGSKARERKEKKLATAAAVTNSDSDIDNKGSPPAVEDSLQIEMIKRLFSLHTSSLLDTKPDMSTQSLTQAFCSTVGDQLINMIDWAKQLPGYCDLAVSDQAVLLQAAWVDIILLTWLFHSCKVEDCVALSGMFSISKSQSTELGFESIYEQLLALILRVKQYEMDGEEMACLKAVALTNAESNGLSCPDKVDNLVSDFSLALQNHSSSRHFNQPHKYAKLILILPQLKYLVNQLIEFLYTLKIEQNSCLSDLVVEMLEAKSRL